MYFRPVSGLLGRGLTSAFMRLPMLGTQWHMQKNEPNYRCGGSVGIVAQLSYAPTSRLKRNQSLRYLKHRQF